MIFNSDCIISLESGKLVYNNIRKVMGITLDVSKFKRFIDIHGVWNERIQEE